MYWSFFYRERRGVFVVGSLMVWMALLALFGPYLPANASVSQKQMNLTVNGHEVLSHWVREDGRWKFKKISRIVRYGATPVRKVAAADEAPATTAAIRSRSSIKARKRAARAELAEEIGRWAKIGPRWEWRQKTPTPPLVTRSKTSHEVRAQRQWLSRNGIWVFDVPVAEDLFINI